MEAQAITKPERKCEDCGAPLGAGREDRKFCNDDCRTNCNNRVRREKQKIPAEEKQPAAVPPPQPNIPNYIARIQAILVNNRRILSHVCDGETPGRIRERDLIGKGFNTKYLTSETESQDSHYRFCFEYGYKKEEDDKYLVICRKREVE
ncbi:MAG: hypothetical protein JWQ66_4460 [Mucilaginibacter sp.]|nr:hypothetical protein [Mucilaginibacter sp.]